MEKLSFTVSRVESFAWSPGKQQSIYWDAKTPGLGLRVTSAGAKAYVFESRLFDRTPEHGSVPKLALRQASSQR
jgi:hypothetical protein